MAYRDKGHLEGLLPASGTMEDKMMDHLSMLPFLQLPIRLRSSKSGEGLFILMGITSANGGSPLSFRVHTITPDKS